MFKRKIKRSVLSILFVMLFLGGQSLSVSATIRPQYVNAEYSSTKLVIVQKQAKASAGISSKKVKNLQITLRLQHYSNAKWTTVKTWSGGKTGSSYNLTGKASLSKNGKYRTMAIIKCGNETITKYSSTVLY